jgi:polysaccharide pyruvyl transferase WcaK-like protein
MFQIRLAAKLGGLNNPTARRVLAADAVLDISGGDSFADLYGAKRFAAVAATKDIAIQHGIPLILLPQTYGPFQSADVRRHAASIVAKSAMAWARDERSFAALKELVGSGFDATRFLSGVDVAFGLRTEKPSVRLSERLAAWIEQRGGAELVGFNVSGLLYNDFAGAKVQYGLKADYRALVTALVNRLIERTSANVMLMPHVVTATGHYESDVDACEAVKAAVVSVVGAGARERLEVAPALALPGQAKWLISKCDWFCGTRMHATIAGLSSGVATSAVAYSIKTLGVFETCGQGVHVADPRTLDTDEVVETIWRSWEKRAEARESLRRELPRTVGAASKQMDQIAGMCVELSRQRKR